MFYTGKGDKGTTQFYGNKKRFSKAGMLAEALGTVDELNSHIGVCKAEYPDCACSVQKEKIALREILHEVQETLFVLQAEIAGAKKTVQVAEVENLERIINRIEKEIPPIKNFVIPGESALSAKLDVLRTLARKAERRVVALHEKNLQSITPESLTYLNRLSSLFYALARLVEYREGVVGPKPKY